MFTRQISTLKGKGKILIFSLVTLLLAIPWPVRAGDTIKIVTTTSDLASIAEEIGREKVRVVSLSRGTQDPHFVEPRPSMVMKTRDADLLIIVGMNLDIWIESLINASRNPRIKPGRPGHLDASVNIEKLDVPPGGKVCAAVMGPHVFCIIYGNPHYWVDPENAKIIASDIARRLGELYPENASFFQENLSDFHRRIDERLIKWQEKLAPFKGEKIITFHKNWPYFAQRFGLVVADELEPKPGIPPSPGHLREIIDKMRREDIRVILQAVFYDERPARFVARETGARVVVVPNSVGGTPEARCYFSLIDTIVGKLAEAFKESEKGN